MMAKHLKDKSILRYLIQFFIMLDIRENCISARQIPYVIVFLEANRINLKWYGCVQTQILCRFQHRKGMLISPISYQQPWCWTAPESSNFLSPSRKALWDGPLKHWYRLLKRHNKNYFLFLYVSSVSSGWVRPWERDASRIPG